MQTKTTRQTPAGDLEPRLAPLKENEMGEVGLAITNMLRKSYNLSETAATPDAVAIMLRHPVMYQAQIEYITKRMRASVLDLRTTELATLRAAWLCQCGYVWGEHVPMAKKAGMTSAQMELITRGPAAPEWSDADRAILQAVDDLHDDAMISDATWEGLAQVLDDKQIIELIVIIGAYHEVSYLYNSLRVRFIPGNAVMAVR